MTSPGVSTDDDKHEQIWTPDPQQDSAMARFVRWVGERRGVHTDGYAELHEWSITDLNEFWSSLAEFADVRWHDRPVEALADARMPGASWFPGGTLNYAEHALRPEHADDALAVVYVREDGQELQLTYGQLRTDVTHARTGLIAAGIGKGDRVVALAPNCVQTLVAFLATASLGAVWSICSPDFGPRAVHDRFAQIEPKVLIAVDGYVFGGKTYDVRPTVELLRTGLTSLRQTVLIPLVDTEARLKGTVSWNDFTERDGPLTFEPVPFDHPLWVLYSSGTTGQPKGIVHGHGGIVLEHIKTLALHSNLGPGERFFWYTTTGWMMWNLVISGLLVGSAVVLYDGSPSHPHIGALWAMAERHRVTVFGVSAGFLQACARQQLQPNQNYDLNSVRTIASTGSPLATGSFRWIADAVGADIQIVSSSGGTDLCAGFLGGAPNVPVWLGELSCAMLGAAVKAYDDDGNELVGEVGELVLTKPMPSMPVAFWNDPDGSRLRQAYFDTYPGVWRHGDWIKITPRRSAIVYGRSDSTLNRGGVRMGTADFYAVVESHDGVADSLVIDTSGLSGGDQSGELLCFLVLDPGTRLQDVEPTLRAALRRELSPRHVPDRFLTINEVPRTLTGKKCEVPVKRILTGFDVEKVVSKHALSNPDALDPFVKLAGGRV